MLKREYYLNQLIESKDLNLIKVITGVRRSGKSTLLLQYRDYLISQKISGKNIIYIFLLSKLYQQVVLLVHLIKDRHLNLLYKYHN